MTPNGPHVPQDATTGSAPPNPPQTPERAPGRQGAGGGEGELYRVAVFDRDGAGGWEIGLYWANDRSGIIEAIQWPTDWPERVNRTFLEAQGFRCEIA